MSFRPSENDSSMIIADTEACLIIYDFELSNAEAFKFFSFSHFRAHQNFFIGHPVPEVYVTV